MKAKRVVFLTMGVVLGGLAFGQEADIQKPDQEAQTFHQTLDALEAQTLTAAAAEDVRSSFKTQHEATYRDTVKMLLTLGRKDDAHHVLERFRAQSLLRLLAERDVVSAERPPEFEERLRGLDTKYDATVSLRQELDPDQQKEAFTAVLKQQRDLRRERERFHVELLRRSSTVAELTYPHPLTVAQIRPMLDPGTLMLSYQVGPEKTYLFAFTRDDEVVVHEIDVGGATLFRQIARLMEQLRQSAPSATRASLLETASWLYGKLLGDVSEHVAKSPRLLIVPDGSLFYVPFAALVGPDGKYLVESKAVHSVVSATVYAQLQKQRRPEDAERPLQVAAFGDPSYPDNGGLRPLPSSRREVVEIAKLYPSSRTFLGKDATEENVKALDDGVDIVHLAAHGVADSVTPLDSFLALSVTDNSQRENGLLQAWEIYERVRLDADLVVLSGGQTAFGPERAGEGLLSLSRAFLAAGTRTVVASLRSLADESTSELMIRFYRHLKAGKTKDEALRGAQLEFIRGPVTFTDSDGNVAERDFSSPYYWATFQVIGDWK